MIRSLLNLALRPLLDFAESKFAEAEGFARDDETHRSVMLGGCSLADELRRHAAGPNPDHCESFFHASQKTQGRQQDHA